MRPPRAPRTSAPTAPPTRRLARGRRPWPSGLTPSHRVRSFSDRELNARLVVQFSGNMKRTVKALVEDN